MKIVPELRNLQSNSSAEVRIAHLLNTVEGEESDFAYHSFALNKHEYKKMAEIDFVIVYRGSVIVLEVKGGRVQRENGMWSFTNRYNETNYKSEGPWDQARTAMFAFKEKIDSLIPNNRLRYTYMVATPDADLSMDIEHEDWQWLGPNDMNPAGIRKKLEFASKEARRKIQSSSQSTSQYWPPDREDMSKLQNVLTKKIDGKIPLNDYLVGLDHERLVLTKKQTRTIQKLTTLPRVTITGGAGTGKTVIAAECARREDSMGSRVAFICQSPGLRSKVGEVLQNTDVAVHDLSSLSETKILFDLLIIDEGQDIINEPSISIMDQALREGFIDGRWLMFMDENNQVLEKEHFDPAVYQDFVATNSLVWQLDENLRNTKSTVTFVESHLAADIGDPSVQIHGPSSRIRVLRNNSADLLSAELDAEIHRLVTRENIRLKDIWIITCKNTIDESSVVASAEGKQPVYKSTSGSVRLVTSHEVKGLETPVALVIDVESLDPEEISKVYVSFTRASLYMCAYVNQKAKAAMEANLVSTYSGKGGTV